MNGDNAEQGGSMAPKQAQASGGRLGQHDKPLWKVDRIAPERCVVCHPEDDEIDPEDGLRPSQLKRIHKCSYVDAGHELHLLATAEHLRMQRAHDVQEWPEPGYDSTTGLRRKPISSWTKDACTPPLEEPTEDDAMKRRNMAMAAALAVGVAMPATTIQAETKASAPGVKTLKNVSEGPVWPNNGIAQRELGNGSGSPDSLFVEHVGDKWIAWAVLTSGDGPAKAINFFTGEVIDVTVTMQLAYTGSFIDAQGVKHESAVHPAFGYKDPRPGGALGMIAFANRSVEAPDELKSFYWSFDTYQLVSDDDRTAIWSKIPFFVCDDFGRKGWDTLFGTALDLNDGTMLVSAGKFVFRLRRDDFTPVGSAPALHIVDETELVRVLGEAKGQVIEDGDAWLTEKLNLK